MEENAAVKPITSCAALCTRLSDLLLAVFCLANKNIWTGETEEADAFRAIKLWSFKNTKKQNVLCSRFCKLFSESTTGAPALLQKKARVNLESHYTVHLVD